MDQLSVQELSTNNETQKHIDMVRTMLERFASELRVRGLAHDRSKLEHPEVKIFTEYTERLSGLTYGSDEYSECLKGMGPALEHHYSNNSHHPEGHKRGVNGMSLFDIVEMLLDWYSATKRHDNGDIRKSIKINEERFDLSPQLVDIFENTVPFLEACEETEKAS